MSVCTQPIVAANRQVAAPMKVTNPIAVGLASNIGDRRHTMNTPAVTIVAAWISAETGVGPSIASGSQVWRPNCADLPIAPTNSSRHSTVIVSARNHRNPIVDPAMFGAAAKISGIEIVLKTRSEEHTSELQSLMRLPYAVFCLHT